MAKSSFSRPSGPPQRTAAPAQQVKRLPAPAAKAAPAKAAGPVKKSAPPPTKPAPAPPAPEPEVIETEVVQEEAPATNGEAAVSVFTVGDLMTAPIGTVVGQIDSSDFPMPWIKLMQPMTPEVVKGEFSAGDWVLNKEAILWQDGCAEVELTVLNIQKKFVQKTTFGEELGKIYDTAEAARADGLVLFGPDGTGYVPFAIALVAIKRPEGVECSVFTREYGDDVYAMAFWQITGAAYRKVASKIYTEGNPGNRLEGGLHTGSFLLSAYLEPGTVAPYWAPIFVDGNMHEPEFVDWLIEQKGIFE